MLLVIDIGNTNTVIGIFKKDNLVTNWRIRTERRTTGDEFSVLASGLFKGSGIQFKDIQRTIISCVVPPVVGVYDAFCRKYLNHAPEWIDAASSGIMPILYGNPSEVGADRIVNAVGAYYKYKKSLIIVDFGTATTFDAVSQNGEYLGGAISPGIMIASEALFLCKPEVRDCFRICRSCGRDSQTNENRDENKAYSRRHRRPLGTDRPGIGNN